MIRSEKKFLIISKRMDSMFTTTSPARFWAEAVTKNFSFLLILFLGLSCSQKPIIKKRESPLWSPKVEEWQGEESVPEPPKDLPKIGLVLGPGGAKTMAHIGVLRALIGQKVSVDFVLGLEWGALVGALCSLKIGRAHV